MLSLLIVLFFLSPQKRYNLEGTWVRVDDEWQGLVVEVSEMNDHLVGKVIKVPKPAYDWGFRTGDHKWKIGKKYNRKLTYSDLYINRNTDYHYYKLSMMNFVSRDTLETQLVKYENEYIGNVQRWVRLNDQKILTSIDQN